MAWYVIYNASTGNPVSLGTTAPGTLDPALAVAEITSPTWEQWNTGAYVWDAATRTVQPRPQEITLVVSGTLRTRLSQRLDYATNTALPTIDAADVALDAVRAAAITTTADARTQIRELARILEDLVNVQRRQVKTTNAVIRLLLGDVYGEAQTYLTSDAGTNGT